VDKLPVKNAVYDNGLAATEGTEQVDILPKKVMQHGTTGGA